LDSPPFEALSFEVELSGSEPRERKRPGVIERGFVSIETKSTIHRKELKGQ
jgi:hypothetical protein